MIDLTEALRRADIDYRTTPDDTVYVDRPDGAWAALGEATNDYGDPDTRGGYDVAFYGEPGEDEPERQDWYPAADEVAGDVRRWLDKS